MTKTDVLDLLKETAMRGARRTGRRWATAQES
jgi:hypothetical protein